jgi:hypothetical protein
MSANIPRTNLAYTPNKIRAWYKPGVIPVLHRRDKVAYTLKEKRVRKAEGKKAKKT